MTGQVRADLDAQPQEVRRARKLLAQHLPAWGVTGDCADVAILLTSELVTNAIRHGRSPVSLQAGLAAGRLRVEINDADACLIRPETVSLDADHGRGLFLVNALADTWGSDVTSSGKCVWFELGRS